MQGARRTRLDWRNTLAAGRSLSPRHSCADSSSAVAQCHHGIDARSTPRRVADASTVARLSINVADASTNGCPSVDC